MPSSLEKYFKIMAGHGSLLCSFDIRFIVLFFKDIFLILLITLGRPRLAQHRTPHQVSHGYFLTAISTTSLDSRGSAEKEVAPEPA